MEYAIESNENGIMVEANWAEHRQGYICPACHRNVFLKKGPIRTSHFSHHKEKSSSCPEYHLGTGIGKSQVLGSFRYQLTTSDYIRRWNSIIRFLLRKSWLDDCQGFEALIRPLCRFLYVEEVRRQELKKALRFLQSFSNDQLIAYNCDLAELAEWANGKSAIVRSKTEVFIRVFENLSPIDKYKTIKILLEYASSDEDKYSDLVRHNLGLTEFSPFRSDGPFYKIPFAEVSNPNEYEVIIKSLTKEKFENLIGTRGIPESHGAYLRERFSNYFG